MIQSKEFVVRLIPRQGLLGNDVPYVISSPDLGNT